MTKKRPRKPKEQENQPGKYDPRNKLNDLTGKEWLLLTKSFWETESCALDKGAYEHPAPFMIPDVKKLISMFTKKEMVVLDPFVGSGTTLIAASMLGRKSYGIDLKPEYHDLYCSRVKDLEYAPPGHYIVGNALEKIKDVGTVDYIVTSPPYHNILRNKTKGIRNNSGRDYRIGPRDGVEYYSDDSNDLGNCQTYEGYLALLLPIMREGFKALRSGKYATIIESDFTVDKKEVCVQADIVNIMTEVGFEFCGTTVLLQPVKPLYPFGYPYAYKINHHHQNIMTFRKPIDQK